MIINYETNLLSLVRPNTNESATVPNTDSQPSSKQGLGVGVLVGLTGHQTTESTHNMSVPSGHVNSCHFVK